MRDYAQLFRNSKTMRTEPLTVEAVDEFLNSVGSNDVARVNAYLGSGMDPNVDHGTALTIAVGRGFGDISKQLISYGATDRASGGLALSIAAGLNCTFDVRLILSVPGAPTPSMCSRALVAAIRANGDKALDIVNDLLKAGASPSKGVRGATDTALEVALGLGAWRCVWAMLDRAA